MRKIIFSVLFFFLFVWSNHLISQDYRLINKYDSLLKLINVKQNEQKVDLLNELTHIKHRKSDYDSALILNQESIKIANQKKYTEGQINAYYLNSRIIAGTTADISKIKENYYSIKNFVSKSSNKYLTALKAEISLANGYRMILDQKNMLIHFDSATVYYDLIDKNNILNFNIIRDYLNEGSAAYKKNRTKFTRDNLVLSYKMGPFLYGTALNNHGNSFLLAGVYDSAFYYLDSSIKFNKLHNNLKGYYLSKSTKGEVYAELNQPKEAIKWIMYSLPFYDSVKGNSERLFYYELLYKQYEKLNDNANALNFLKKYTDLKDTINNNEKMVKINQLEKNYAVEQKQQQLQLSETNLQKQQFITKFLIAGVAIIVIVAIILAFLINRQRKTNRLLDIRKHEIEKQKEVVEKAKDDIELLSEIGKKITSTLDIYDATRVIYANVNQLMEAAVLGVGIYNDRKKELSFRGLLENGESLGDFSISIDDDRLAAVCFKNNKEIIINGVEELTKYVKVQAAVKGNDTESLIYLPLINGEKVLGVLTVQSFKRNAYNEYHLFILRNLAVYIAITIENYNAYQQTNRAYDKLKGAQSQLVQSEKMASLGQLTAGVAHEINNPINYISGGIDSLKTCFNELSELLEIYKVAEKEEDEAKKLEYITKATKFKKEIDFAALEDEIKGLLSSIKTGANRTTEIVKSLRTFSRLDEDSLKRANIEEGIDATLVILRSQLKDKVEVIKEYSGIPEISCYPGQLNQVFMNIISNAAQAIEGTGQLFISTLQTDESVIIKIKDTGKGMPEDVRKRIFEPFFTTKDVGEGTGLGLSIAIGIIEKHKGKIEVNSEVGKGTEFIITLSNNLS